MGKILAYYTKYREHVPEYNRWSKEHASLDAKKNATSKAQSDLKTKAKTIAEPLLLLDKYEHEKAEDAETFFQTYNIELMSLTTLLCSIPIAATKIIPFLEKHSKQDGIIKSLANLLNKYKNAAFTVKGKNIPIPKIAAVISAVGGGIFFAKGIKHSMESQLGIIRKASFDATQTIINDPKLFAVLTPEQENQLKTKVQFNKKNNNGFVDIIKEKINLNSTIKTVKEFSLNQDDYKKRKENYYQAIKTNPDVQNDENQILYENLLKTVEHDVLEQLRKVETISNISYSAMFTGGFLEYLITDKLVDTLGVKNKLLQIGLKIGVPLITYMLLNKNISDIENKAILATKYKHLKHFTEHPESPLMQEDNKNLFEFVKTVIHDMKEYDKFAREELPEIEQKLDAKRDLKLTKEQMEQAKILQNETCMVINKQREKLYEQSVGIKAFSETILGPLDIAATAVGGFIGNKAAKKCTNKKLAGILTGLGAVIAFIPAAIIEAKLTKQQKLSEKIAAMLAIKEIKQPSKQIHYSNVPDIFKEFK